MVLLTLTFGFAIAYTAYTLTVRLAGPPLAAYLAQTRARANELGLYPARRTQQETP